MNFSIINLFFGFLLLVICLGCFTYSEANIVCGLVNGSFTGNGLFGTYDCRIFEEGVFYIRTFTFFNGEVIEIVGE